MKRIEYYMALFLLVTMLFSCTADVTEKVLLNGLEFPTSLQAPEDEESFQKVMADAVKCRVVAIDKSTPSGDVDSRVWVLKNSYGDVVRTVEDSTAIRLSLPVAGVYSLNLTINGDVEGSITNWIKVEGEVEGIVSNSLVDFASPSRAFEVSNERNYTVLLNASIWEEDLEFISISHNGKELKSSDYEFNDAEEQIIFSVKLKEGENIVQVSGEIEGEAIDVTRTIEYIKEGKSSGSSQLAQNTGGSSSSNGSGSSTGSENRSTIQEEQPRPEEPLANQNQQQEERTVIVEEEQEETETVVENTPPPPADPVVVVEEEIEEVANDEVTPTNMFDIGYKLKSLSAYNQEKILGIKVLKLSELTGDCALAYSGGSYSVEITDLKDIMYIKSFKLAQNPGTEGQDVTFKLECLNSDRLGRSSRTEDGVVGYTDDRAEDNVLSRLNKMPLLPGNSYRLTVTCEAATEIGYVDASKCSGKIDSNELVKLNYKDGKCPFFSLKLKH